MDETSSLNRSADDLAVIRWTITDNLNRELAPSRDIRLPKGLKRSIAVMAALDLLGKRLKEDVTAVLTAQGFK